jgi:exonuclease III
VGDLNIPLSPINKTSKENPKREMMENRCYKPNEVTDIYRTIHTNTKEYTCFSAPQGTFSKTDHIF